MLYAATKATVKREFQSDVIADEVAATSKVITEMEEAGEEAL